MLPGTLVVLRYSKAKTLKRKIYKVIGTVSGNDSTVLIPPRTSNGKWQSLSTGKFRVIDAYGRQKDRHGYMFLTLIEHQRRVIHEVEMADTAARLMKEKLVLLQKEAETVEKFFPSV